MQFLHVEDSVVKLTLEKEERKREEEMCSSLKLFS